MLSVKVQEARDYLLRTMEAPPSLLELSGIVGLNDDKLKIGFKAEYGDTVFGYLRRKRMEKAWHQLHKEEMTVSEAALLVGYSNFGHLAEAFRKQYGVNPSDIIRKR